MEADALELTGAVAFVWFLVFIIRSYLTGIPKVGTHIGTFLDGNYRTWGLVLVVAFGVNLLIAEPDTIREAINGALNMAIGAVGVDNIKKRTVN